VTRVILLVFVLGLSFSYCSKKKSEVSKNTYEYFSTHLNAGITYSQIVATFGEPDGDLGSGIHIYYYNLDDGTCIVIGFADRIIYARHISNNTASARLLHTLV
jgi:hypothetical protein